MTRKATERHNFKEGIRGEKQNFYALMTSTRVESTAEACRPLTLSPVRNFVNGLCSKVTLRVPATTANLGPGYDTLGMALNIFLDLTVEVSDKFSFVATGEGAEYITKDDTNMVVDACRLAMEKYANLTMPPLKFTMHNSIPFGCGCGSSAGAVVGGFVAGMILSGLRMETRQREHLLSVIAGVEGHADNAAAAIYGGIQICIKKPGDAETYSTYRVPTPKIQVVLFLPDKRMKASTHAARTLIPSEVSIDDAVKNISSTAVLLLALTSGEMRLLADVEDRLHENQRASALYPHFAPCAKAGRDAGADYVFLSGAGPTVCAFVKSPSFLSPLTVPDDERVAERVAMAMVAAAATVGVKGRGVITRPTEHGVHVAGVTENFEKVHYVSV